MNNKSCIIFDAFWTLIETTWAEKYYKKSLEILKKHWDIKKLNLLTSKYPNFSKHYYENILKQLWKDKNSKVIDELVFLFNYEKEFYKLKPYTKELLDLLKDEWKHISVVSNLSSLYVPILEDLLFHLPINKFYYSCELWIKKNKDDLFIYKYVLKDLWINSKQAIFTWDSLVNDVLWPSKLGIKSFLIDEFVKERLN